MIKTYKCLVSKFNGYHRHQLNKELVEQVVLGQDIVTDSSQVPYFQSFLSMQNQKFLKIH
jgi:hypothetical protein